MAGQTLSAYNPSWRDRIAQALMGDSKASPERANAVKGLLGSTGLGSTGPGLVDFTPAGGVFGAQESAQAGDAKGLAMAMLPMPARAGKGIIAYHGSPHSFDRFDLSKIGTGEGAQAYGHGLYFAEKEGVARSYRDALAAQGATINGKPVTDLAAEKYRLGINASPTPEQDIADYISSYQDNARFMMEKRAPHLLPLYDQLKESGALNDKGHMYQVRINADPEHFLDWDKPLSEQGKAVQSVSDEMKAKSFLARRALERPDASGRDMWEKSRNAFVTGAGVGNDAAASSMLREAGIPGIKYLDQGSRNVGDGSRNYVVFDDKLIDILKKYGLVGLLGGGGIGAAAMQPNSEGPAL